MRARGTVPNAGPGREQRAQNTPRISWRDPTNLLLGGAVITAVLIFRSLLQDLSEWLASQPQSNDRLLVER